MAAAQGVRTHLGRGDAVALAIVGALAAVALGGERVHVATSRRAATRARWERFVEAAKGAPARLFVDARGAPLPPLSVTWRPAGSPPSSDSVANVIGDGDITFAAPAAFEQGRVERCWAYESAPDAPRDPWGARWFVLCYASVERAEHPEWGGQMGRTFFLSAGPDGRLEFGRGDDLSVSDVTRAEAYHPERARVPWWLAGVAAGAVAIVWVSLRAAAWPRTERGTSEVLLGALSALAPACAVVGVVVALDVDRWFALPDGLVVRPREALAATGALVMALAGVALRLRARAAEDAAP